MQRRGLTLRRVAHHLQLAGIAMRDGRTDLGRSLYQRAIDAMGSSNRLERSARWHYGWDLHRAGDDVGVGSVGDVTGADERVEKATDRAESAVGL